VGCLPYQASSVSRDKRIAVIQLQRWDVQSNNIKLSVIRNVVPAIDAFRAQGGEIHWYKSTFFETDFDHREMWTDIGSQYAAVLVLYPTTVTTAMTRYFCADSTNGQLIVIGGAEMGSGQTWQCTSGPPCTNERGLVDSCRYGNIFVSSTSGAGLVSLDDQDTLWCKRGTSGQRIGVLPTGVDQVVRLLRPITTSGTSFFVGNVDSTTYRPPGSWNTSYGADWTPGSFARALAATKGDSVAGPGELLSPIWKVHYTQYSGQSVTTWINSLASPGRGVGGGGTSPQWAYFVKVVDNVNPGDELTHLIWALMCKFTTVDPIKWAYDWDDVTDINNSPVYPRWRNSAAESSLVALKAYGIVPTNNINPRNAAAYLDGRTPDYEPQWTGPPHSYLKKLTWAHHSHDSTQSNISSNLIGGFGGYNPGNGYQLTQGAQNIEIMGHRFASRYDPTSNGQPGSPNFGAGGRYGIVQRLAYSDSLRKAESPESLIPPYLASPANQFLPVNWRARPTTSNPLWTLFYSAAASCPIDSIIWALDYGLNGQQTSGYGKVTFRISMSAPWGYSAGTLWPGYGTADQDRDSMVAATWFKRGGEKRIIRVGNRTIEAVAVNSILQGVSGRNAYMDDGEARALTVLGLKGGSVMAEKTRTEWGSSYIADPNGANRPASNGNVVASALAENFRQTTRVIYQHPGQFTTAPGAVNNSSADYHVEVFIRSIAPHIRALDLIACRPATICVPAWQVHP
jgi:hypothetical protein